MFWQDTRTTLCIFTDVISFPAQYGRTRFLRYTHFKRHFCSFGTLRTRLVILAKAAKLKWMKGVLFPTHFVLDTLEKCNLCPDRQASWETTSPPALGCQLQNVSRLNTTHHHQPAHHRALWNKVAQSFSLATTVNLPTFSFPSTVLFCTASGPKLQAGWGFIRQHKIPIGWFITTQPMQGN